ncbi:MAG TPA: ABC transporter substrate-binding protein [Chloroflexia bacterium]|nr:ABC transporter substrate-binding protein [Chloroflexia bacterium]
MTFGKRPWFGLLALSLLISLMLAACGDNTPAPSSTQSSAGGQATAASGASGGVTDLNILIYPASTESGMPPADWAGYKVIRDKLGINLKLNLLPAGNEGDLKLSTLAASNSLPDLMNFEARNRGLFYQFVDQGLIAPVESLLPMMPQRTKDRYSDPDLNKLVTVNGKLYGLQPSADAQLYRRYGIAIRQDWLDKLGLKAPTTLDEFLNVAKAFTEKDPDGNGKNDTYGFGGYINSDGVNLGVYLDFIFGAYGEAGTWNLSDLSKPHLNVRDPNYPKALGFLKQLVDSKVIDPDWATLKGDDFRSRWKQGKYGMFVEDFAALTAEANYKAFDTNFPNGVIKYIAPPKGPDGKNAMTTFVKAGNQFYAISKKAVDSGKLPAIAKLLEWANSGEGYYLLGFGKEGVNYKIDAQGNITSEGIDPKLQYLSKDQQANYQMKWMAYKGSQQELRARYSAYKTKAGRDQDTLEFYKTGFNYPYQDATPTQVIKPPSNSADIYRYVSEGLVQFVLGQKPLDDQDWKTFINGLDGLGVSQWEASAAQDMQKAGYGK